ncbi:HvfC family RiPP maturation protein [Rheinheimera sp.]|uniref:HvfC family RiPP maturation protein n=1 Tax=Rheinheimera sp. TaxID=1869214 RepID=UPI002FDE2008
MTKSSLDFQAVQQQFAAAIRDPANAAPATVNAERMAVYQQLFFNNVQNFVNSAFPVLHSLYPASLWQQKLRQFFAQSSLSSPYFLDIAAGFFQWFSSKGLSAEDPAFAIELAHYEWLELYLATTTSEAQTPRLETLHSTQPLQFSELALLLCYQYPVMQISRDFQPTVADGPYYLLMYRNDTDEIKFVSLNELSATTMQILATTPGLSLDEVLAQLKLFIPAADPEVLQAGAAELFSKFARKGVIRAFQAG